MINGARYISVEELAVDKGLKTHWDASLKNIEVTGKFDSIKFHVGSEYVLSRDKLVRLDDKVRFVNGQVLVPASASVYLDALVVKPTNAKTPAPTTRMISQALYGEGSNS